MTRTLAPLALAAGLLAPAAEAQDFYIGQILTTAASYCPSGTIEADGQILPINSNQALFALIGTLYGGDGRVTFALPDLRGRAPVHLGTGPGLPAVNQGESAGAVSHTLTVAEMAPHGHAGTGTPSGVPTPASAPSPAAALPALTTASNVYAAPAGATVAMAADSVAVTVGNTGGGQAFDLRNPYLGLRFCIVLSGIFPPRND